MSFCCRIAEGFLTGKPGMTGENNASVTGSRSRPRGSTCSILAFQRRNFTGEPNEPLDSDGRWFAKGCEEVLRHRIRH
jgi:hypothetical protein